MKTWLDEELAGSQFADLRLKKRFKSLISSLSNGLDRTIPFACGDWAATKAAYRFLDNDRVNESAILGGHFEATKARFAATNGPILVLQDTTEFSFNRNRTDIIGKIGMNKPGTKDADGRYLEHVSCGLLMHSSLAVTTEGLPLGLAAIKFWNRKKFKGCNALKKKINPTRVPIEEKESVRCLENLRQSTDLFYSPGRCVHVGDRESDIYELFCLAHDLGTNFLVRTCVNRRAGDGSFTIADEMDEVKVKGLHRLEIREKGGEVSSVVLEIKYKRICVKPPIGKQKKYPDQMLTVIHATERGNPKGREKLCWKLLTNLQVTSRADAIEKLKWYALRWQIETFHKILKSGCRAEDSNLRNAERLVNLLATFCILGWRQFWVTMINRSAKNLTPSTALTREEIQILGKLLPAGKKSGRKNLTIYLTKIAQLGGYLARAKDPPPGNIVMLRGLARLTDIKLGFQIATANVGN